MKRRQLLAAVPVGALGLLAGGCADQPDTNATDTTEREQMPGRKLTEFGLQLSTITPLLMADFEGTLSRVAEIGYRQVEFSALGFLGRPVGLVKELLATHGLNAPVGRISPVLPESFATMPAQEQMVAFRQYAGPQYLLENIRHALEATAALGQEHLVLPALMADRFSSRDETLRSIELLRQAGELCAASGVQFGYHNHDWEFNEVDGVVPYDLMLEQIEPELMSFQMDVYWVTKGSRDPLAYLSEFPGRFPTCHLKDIDAGGDFADVGSGTIDFPQFIAAAKDAGTQYYFVERDRPPEPMQTAERAFAYLQTMTY